MPVFTPRVLLAHLLLATTLLALMGCAQPTIAGAGNRAGCVDHYDPGLDYFPDKVRFDHATGVDVSYRGATKLVTVRRPWQGATEPLRVLLVQCGTPAPDDRQADVVVEVPVRRAATFSTTQLPGFALLDRTDTVVAHAGLRYATTPAIVEAAQAGDVRDVGDQTAPDLEALLAAQPDVALLSAGLDGDAYRAAVEQVGVPAVPYADWLEDTLLGRAEWLKVIALLTNTERRAEKAFAEIAEATAEMVARAERADARPTVLAGSPHEGTWFVPAGGSYVASALAAAGADYPWAHSEGTGALPLDLEAVIDRAADAAVWVGAGSVRGTLDEVAALDDRVRDFRSVRTGRVYADDRWTNGDGGNALYEIGAVRPDLVLADLFKILHPEQATDLPFTFYGRVGALRGLPS